MQQFKKLYRLPNHKIRENTNMNSFVFCGRNWDYYFATKNKDSELEMIENVAITNRFDARKYIDSDADISGTFLQYV